MNVGVLASGAGSFTFRYGINDVTPPVLRLASGSSRQGSRLRVIATDSGAGVNPTSIVAAVEGRRVPAAFRGGVITISTAGLEPGTYRLRVRVSDYQEAKNTENVGPILPNTRTTTVTFRVR